MYITKKQLTNLNRFRKSNVYTLTCLHVGPEFITGAAIYNHGMTFYSARHGICGVESPRLVPTAEFIKIAKKYGVTAVSAEGQKTALSTPAGSFSFDVPELSEFPEIPTATGDSRPLPFSAGELQGLSVHCSADDLRPAMMGVYLDPDGPAVSTNGRRLQWIDREGQGEGFIIPKDVIGLLTGSTYNVCELSSDLITGGRAFSNENETVYFKPIDEKYPDWRQVLPDPKKTTVHLEIDKAEFLAAMEAAKLISYNGNFRLKFAEKAVTLHAECLDENKSYDSKPIGFVSWRAQRRGEPSEGADVIGFAPDVAIPMAKQMQEQFMITVETPNRAAYFGSSAIVMPLMFSQYA